MKQGKSNSQNGKCRPKLGLALAGGGFRASLFHLGVLHRMAELDLLRQVEVMSTVSGGSILGALYFLVLKKELETKATLTRDEYRKIVTTVESMLTRAIQKNLRTRLFLNPFGILRVLLTEDSLGKRMSRLYERHLYKEIVEKLQLGSSNPLRPGKIALRDLRIGPKGQPKIIDLGRYNARHPKVSKIPKFILNATSLNSGQRFSFSSTEIGDPHLGFFRYDEIISELEPRKNLLESSTTALLAKVAIIPAGAGYKVAVHALWWKCYLEGIPPYPIVQKEPWLYDCTLAHDFGAAEIGLLRRVKLAAWYLRRGLPLGVNGGLTRRQHLNHFWDALERINETRTKRLKASIGGNTPKEEGLLEFFLHLYYLRSAEAMSPRLRRDWENLTLGEAVGASACFPPVFPPFTILGIYDDAHVSQLGLTDGGAYDNCGIKTLLEEDCTYMIVSDTGSLFNIQKRISPGRVGMGARLVSMMMENIGELQRTLLREKRRVSRGIASVQSSKIEFEELKSSYKVDGLAYFHINSPLSSRTGSGIDPLDQQAIASIRTDLDGFGDVEIDALIHLGYHVSDQYIRQYLANAPFMNTVYWAGPSANKPIKFKMNRRVRQIVSAGKSRIFRAVLLGSKRSWGFTLLILAAASFYAYQGKVSIGDAVRWMGNLLLSLIGSTPIIGKWLTSCVANSEVTTLNNCSLWFFILAVGIVGLLILLTKVIALPYPKKMNSVKEKHPSWLRKLFFVTKWVKSYSPNVLWFFGLAPIWIALGAAAAASISYLFYHLPFLSKTRR